MSVSPLDLPRDLDACAAAELLEAAEEALVRRRRAEVDDLRVVAAWADLHSSDPRRDPETGRRVWAEDRLVLLGGEGTPGVREFCIGELALARRVSVPACESALADVLDLRHRLPRVWRHVEAGECEVWVARRVARMSRRLPADRVVVVDLAVATAVVHEARVEAERRRRYVALSRTDEHGLRQVIARVSAGDAVWIDATVARIAELIADRHPGAGVDELRSLALGWLARPAEALQLLLEGQDGDETCRATAFPADLLDTLRTVRPERLRPQVRLFVHLSDLALAGLAAPVARVEGIGPLLADHDLFDGCAVTVTPVIDLADRVSLTCYEHPTWLRRRRLLITPDDTFPHAAGTPGLAGRPDLDHPTPYDDHGPPGQTGVHNSAPLGRRHHRWKTHAGYASRQSGTTRWVWRTPHGRHYPVDHAGTRRIDDDAGELIMTAPPGLELYPVGV
jgi:antitoxin (DNA-binding transcriptional repressor) of toxin-antitoxin stability system